MGCKNSKGKKEDVYHTSIEAFDGEGDEFSNVKDPRNKGMDPKRKPFNDSSSDEGQSKKPKKFNQPKDGSPTILKAGSGAGDAGAGSSAADKARERETANKYTQGGKKVFEDDDCEIIDVQYSSEEELNRGDPALAGIKIDPHKKKNIITGSAGMVSGHLKPVKNQTHGGDLAFQGHNAVLS